MAQKNPNIKKANTEQEFDYEQIQELKRCASDPKYFIKTYVKIQHPVKGAIDFNLRPYQERMIDAYQGSRYTVVLASRQIGKTEIAAAYLLWFAIFHFDKNVLIASNKNKNAMEIVHKIKFAYESLPQWIKPGVLDDGWNKHSLGFDNGSRIISEATSENSGRGMAISLLYLDEFAFVAPVIQEEFWTSISPTLATGGNCIITSTPNGDMNIFAHIWRGALVQSNGFKPVQVDWDEPPDRDEKFKEQQINLIGEHRWKQEYEVQFLSSDALLFDSRVLANRKEEMNNVPEPWLVREVKFWEEIKKQHTYLVGVDPATGSGQDYTAIVIFEFPSLNQVAEYRSNTMSPNEMYEVLKNILKYLEKNDTMVYFSIENNGVGEGLISLYEQDEDPPENAEFISEEGANRRGMTTMSRVKMRACVNFKEMWEKHQLHIRSSVLFQEMKQFVRHRGSYAAQYGSTDDLISATLIVVRLIEELSTYEQAAFDKLYSSQVDEWDEWWENSGSDDYNENDTPLPISV